MNPNTWTLPVFRHRRDADITKHFYRLSPVLVRDTGPDQNPWQVTIRQNMFSMSTADAELFRTRQQLEQEGWTLSGNVFTRDGAVMLPLYEAKMVHQFDHRFGTYDGQTVAQARQGKLPETSAAQHSDPTFAVLPKFWIPEADLNDRLGESWRQRWLLGWRDITGSENSRTVISAIIPRVGAADSYSVLLPAVKSGWLLQATLCSFVVDFATRQKIGGKHLRAHVFKQLPLLPPAKFQASYAWAGGKLETWIRARVLELSYTAWDLQWFARDLDWSGPPFRWHEHRRQLLRCELDAAFFHLYGSSRDDAAYILDSFWVIRERDQQAYGEYRTKRVILEIFDAIQHATAVGIPYQTLLDPPPADPRVAHPALPPSGAALA
jgi:hypothetical protein